MAEILWTLASPIAFVALCCSVFLELHSHQYRFFGHELDYDRRLVAFIVLAIGALFLFAPVTWEQCFSSDLGEGWEPGGWNYISWFITNLFTVGWTTTIQTGLTDITSVVNGGYLLLCIIST